MAIAGGVNDGQTRNGKSIIGRDQYGRPIWGVDPTSVEARTQNQTQDTTTNTVQKQNTVQNLTEQIRQSQSRTWQEQIAETMNEVISRGDPASNAALQSLIQTLLGGGTDEQQAQRQARRQEIASAQAGRADYSKGAAFADSSAAAQAASRQALEQSLANINRAIAGAGTSGGSMQALLAQNATRDAQELQAKLQLETAVNYGQIGTQYQSILEALTRPDNSQVDSLLAALNLAMQANQSTTRNTTTNRTGQELTDSTTNRTQNTTTDMTGTTDTTQKVFSQLIAPLVNSRVGGGGGGRIGGGGIDSRQRESDAWWAQRNSGAGNSLMGAGNFNPSDAVDYGLVDSLASLTGTTGNAPQYGDSASLWNDKN